MSTFAAIQKRGTVSLPPEIRAHFGLDKPGAQVEIFERDGEIVLRPHVPVPADQAWFWSPGWQAREREAQEQADRGDGARFESVDDFIDHLTHLDEQ